MTQILVLGMLTMNPMSGYEIKQSLRATDAERWGGVLVGSIYHALGKLNDAGYVALSGLYRSGRRYKSVYEITPAGRAYLRTLIREALQEPSVEYPSALYSGLSFYTMLSRDECREALRRQTEELDRECETLNAGLEAKNEAMNHQVPPMVTLIMDHMFTIVLQQKAFVEKALALLDSKD